jgi:hypothetical protein
MMHLHISLNNCAIWSHFAKQKAQLTLDVLVYICKKSILLQVGVLFTVVLAVRDKIG